MKDLSGKTVLVTGASSGIGRVAAERLAERGATLVLAGRSRASTLAVVDAIRTAGGQADFVQLDLGDLESVRQCAAEVLDRSLPLDVLINNAGQAGERGTTPQGFQRAFGVNHLGPFLLTQLLLPKLLESASRRVVNVSSKAHLSAKSIDFAALRRPSTTVSAIADYGVSKLCNVLHAKELARRYGPRGLHACALHPGVVATGVWRQVPQPFRSLIKLFMISEAEGAETTLYCATSPDIERQNGLYYDRCRELQPSRAALDPELAALLWEKSSEWAS